MQRLAPSPRQQSASNSPRSHSEDPLNGREPTAYVDVSKGTQRLDSADLSRQQPVSNSAHSLQRMNQPTDVNRPSIWACQRPCNNLLHRPVIHHDNNRRRPARAVTQRTHSTDENRPLMWTSQRECNDPTPTDLPTRQRVPWTKDCADNRTQVGRDTLWTQLPRIVQTRTVRTTVVRSTCQE